MQASSLYMEGRKDPYKLSASMQEYILKKGLLFAVIFDELRQYIWCGMEICDSLILCRFLSISVVVVL